jgi:hypothetical protein
MKIISTLKNTKSDKQIKLANLLAANLKRIRYNGQQYLIRVAKVASMVLASAEPVQGISTPVNLFDNSIAAKEMKKLVENKLYS